MFNWKNTKSKKKTNLDMMDSDRYLKISKSLHNQKKVNLILLLIIILLTVILGKVSFSNNTKTYIVEKDHNNYTYLGNVQDLTKTNYNPSDNDLVYFLNLVVKNMRFLPSDLVLFEKNRVMVNSFLTQPAIKKMKTLDERYDYERMKKENAVVDIEPISTIRVSSQAFQIRWIERVYSVKGVEIASRLMVGFFKYEISSPTSQNSILSNPLGIKILDMSISEEKNN